MMTIMQVLGLKRRVAEAFARHRAGTVDHESPPCGGCHFWQGYEGAITDILSGQMPTEGPLRPSAAAAQKEMT